MRKCFGETCSLSTAQRHVQPLDYRTTLVNLVLRQVDSHEWAFWIVDGTAQLEHASAVQRGRTRHNRHRAYRMTSDFCWAGCYPVGSSTDTLLTGCELRLPTWRTRIRHCGHKESAGVNAMRVQANHSCLATLPARCNLWPLKEYRISCPLYPLKEY